MLVQFTLSTILKSNFSLLPATLPARAPCPYDCNDPQCRSESGKTCPTTGGHHRPPADFRLFETHRLSAYTDVPSYGDSGERLCLLYPAPAGSAPVPPAPILKSCCYSCFMINNLLYSLSLSFYELCSLIPLGVRTLSFR